MGRPGEAEASSILAAGSGGPVHEATVPPLARELAPRRVNAVSPGVIETQLVGPAPSPGNARRCSSRLRNRRPFGATAGPRTSRCSLIENDYITSVVFPCDGGLRLTQRCGRTRTTGVLVFPGHRPTLGWAVRERPPRTLLGRGEPQRAVIVEPYADALGGCEGCDGGSLAASGELPARFG